MIDLKTIADNANMIVSGYAFTKEDNFIRVLNLNNPKAAALLDIKGEVLETNMCPIESRIVKDIYLDNEEFMYV